jgi:hypothetical protein
MATQLTLECTDEAVATALIAEMIGELQARGMRPGTRNHLDYEACKRFMHAWRGRRHCAGQSNLGYERCVREIAVWVGV